MREKTLTNVIDRSEIQTYIKSKLAIEDVKPSAVDVSDILPMVKETLVETVLIHTRGNQSQAARILGINRGTLRALLNKERQAQQ